MKNFGRRKFSGSSINVFGLESFDFIGSEHFFIKTNKSDKSDRIIRLTGKQNSEITHLNIITIDNFSRNRYWSESHERAIHRAICTCTAIPDQDFYLICDPSLADQIAMTTELKRRTELTPNNIDGVFITHQHRDYVVGLKHFLKARWITCSEVA